ncbi:MAG: hypothetical protein IT305_22275 [Chloroflexi bacterium]|nr:hypothetical protein [Chloroflexota bacterium]
MSAIRAIAHRLARLASLVRGPLAAALLGILALSGSIGSARGAVVYAADDGPDPADYLPSGAGILQAVRADANGDGRTDSVVLYTLPAAAGMPVSASILVLTTTDGAPRVSQLFGPPDSLRGNPILDPNGSATIQVRDVTGDNQPEILLTVVQQYQEPAPRSLLWVFRAANPSAGVPPGFEPLPNSPEAANAAARAPFRLEAFLQGNAVDVLGPDAPGGPGLRVQATQRQLSGPNSSVLQTSVYRWRNDGYRLTTRVLDLPAGTDPTGGPDAVALGYFAALAHGNTQIGYSLLAPRLQAEQTPEAFAASAPRVAHVEEVHLLPSRSSSMEGRPANRTVYVRIVQAGEPERGGPRAAAQIPPATAAQIPPAAGRPGGEVGQTRVGMVHVHRDGETWHVDGVDLRPAPPLASLADALPPGSDILETAQGDLRQRGVQDVGVQDVGVVMNRPGRFPAAEPVVLFASPHSPDSQTVGAWQPVLLSNILQGGDTFAFYGDLTFEDVNADGRLAVVFDGGVGAHSGLLWIVAWDGSALVPLFQTESNTPGIELEDLDRNGKLEILIPQSGYCGSYASSPTLIFVERWQDGAYRPASADYPSVYAGFEAQAASTLAAPVNSANPAAVACIQHMRAAAFAFENRPAEMLAAYRAYLAARQQAEAKPSQNPNPFITPIYLSEAYVEEDLRLVLDRVTSSDEAGWGTPETAALHLMLADALDAQAQAAESDARSAEQQGDQETAARQHAVAARATSAAAAERAAARSLAPDLGE